VGVFTMRVDQGPPQLLKAKENPVVPLEFFDMEPTDRYETDDPINLAIAKYYYERDWKVTPIVTRSIDGVDHPYFAIISRFDEQKGMSVAIPIGWLPGDLPTSEEMRRARFDYGENQMVGPLRGKGELWVTHNVGPGKWTADRWVLHSVAPRWRKAETIEFSTEG